MNTREITICITVAVMSAGFAHAFAAEDSKSEPVIKEIV